MIRGQLGRRLELQRLVPQRHIGLTDVATDSERHSSRYGADRQAESTRPGEGTTRVRLKRCDLVACLAHVGMQVLVARPSVAREHDRRTWSPGVVAKLQARAERQDNKLGGDLSTALMPKEQQLLVSMRKVRQREGILDGERAARVRGEAYQGLASASTKIHFNLLAWYEVLAGEADHRIRRQRVVVKDDPRSKPLDVEAN